MMRTMSSGGRTGVGRLVRERRVALGISQVVLSERTGIAQRTISRIENTNDPDYLPEPRLMVPLARELGLDMTDVLREAGYLPGEELPVDDQTQIFTSTMQGIDRMELPERVKRMMREAVEYARELSEQNDRRN